MSSINRVHSRSVVLNHQMRSLIGKGECEYGVARKVSASIFDLWGNDILEKMRNWLYKVGDNVEVGGIVLLKEPEACEELLKTKEKLNNTTVSVGRVASGSVFVTQGSEGWSDVRKVHPFNRVLDTWYQKVSERVDELCDVFVQRFSSDDINGRESNLYDIVLQLVFEVYCDCCLGVDGEAEIDMLWHFCWQGNSMTRQLMLGMWPMSIYFFLGRKRWNARIREIVKKRERDLSMRAMGDLEVGVDDDLLTVICKIDGHLDEQQINEFTGLFWGGMYSMTMVIVGTLYHVTCSDKQFNWLVEKGYGGVEGVGGDGSCEFFKRCTCAVFEGMRMYPGAPLVIRHLNKDVDLAGFKAKSGTKVGYCPFAMHSDPMYWKEPCMFDMLRFEKWPMEKLVGHAYMPFGIDTQDGGRGCVGAKYAMAVMPAVVGGLLKHGHIYVEKVHSERGSDKWGRLRVMPWAGSCKPVERIVCRIAVKTVFEKTVHPRSESEDIESEISRKNLRSAQSLRSTLSMQSIEL